MASPLLVRARASAVADIERVRRERDLYRKLTLLGEHADVEASSPRR
jgi:hypothetical protein